MARQQLSFSPDEADIAVSLGEMRGQLHALTESVVSLRGHVDALGAELEQHLRELDARLRSVERDAFLLTRVGGFAAGSLALLLGWLVAAIV